MKEIELKSLHLKSFKGIKNLDLDFDPQTTRIHGDNATGKTTVFDAFTWLLFGKDSQDRKDFNIKPLDAEGRTSEKNETEVEAILKIDGNTTSIRRVFSEKWTKKRGSEKSEFTGNETKYFWNEVPFSASEFEAAISSEIINEATFKILTNTERFSSLNWKDQRSILFDFAKVQTDEELALSLPKDKQELTSLVIGTLNAKKTLDQYKKEIASKKKLIKDELEQIPARISELQNIKPETEFSELEGMQAQTEILQNIRGLNEQITNENNRIASANAELNKAIAENQSEINQFKIDLNNYLAEKQIELNGEVNQKKAEASELQHKHNELQKLASRHLSNVNRLRIYIDSLKKDKDALVKEWQEANEEAFVMPTQDKNCPSCGQPIKEEINIDALRTKFNEDKVCKLTDIEKRGFSVKENLDKQLKEYELELELEKEASKELDKIVDVLQSFVIPEQNPFEGDEKSRFYEEEIARLEAKVFEVPSADTVLEILKKRKASFESDLAGIRSELARHAEIKRIDTRIKELEDREAVLSSELASFEKQEFQIEEFTRIKIKSVEEKINSMFEFVRFKMFKQLINGAIEETCEAEIDGVPYSNANNAARINAGLDIIQVLSKNYEVAAPCFIDNAESVTKFKSFSNQLILLVVDESCKKLTIK